MPKFSEASKQKLETCDPELQILFNYVIRFFDCTVICGERGKEAQNKAFAEGFSTVQYPHSKHNKSPSRAVDVVPYPVEWMNTDRMRYFIGFVKGLAKILKEYGLMEKEIITGIDWDNDTDLSDTRFKDFPHFEIQS